MARLRVNIDADIIKKYPAIRRVLVIIADRAENGIIARYLLKEIAVAAPLIRELIEFLDKLFKKQLDKEEVTDSK